MPAARDKWSPINFLKIDGKSVTRKKGMEQVIVKIEYETMTVLYFFKKVKKCLRYIFSDIGNIFVECFIDNDLLEGNNLLLFLVISLVKSYV